MAAAPPQTAPAAGGREWLWRRYAGLPLLVWLAAALLLAVALAVAGWLFLGRSGEQSTDEETSDTTATIDETSETAAEPPVPQATPKLPAKKPPRRPPPGKKREQPASEPSGPSPLDGLKTLGTAAPDAAPASDGK